VIAVVRVGGPNPQQIRALTSSDVVTVSPSGDMARKAPYDRNMDAINNYYSATVSAHAWTVRWSYTVPANHLYENGLAFSTILTAIATAGRMVSITIQTNISAAGWRTIFNLVHFSTTDAATCLTLTAAFCLKAGDAMRTMTYSDDTVDHAIGVGTIGMEFDA